MTVDTFSVLHAAVMRFETLKLVSFLGCAIGLFLWYWYHLRGQIDCKCRDLEEQLKRKLAKIDPEWNVSEKAVGLANQPFWNMSFALGSKGRPFASRNRNGSLQWIFHHETTLFDYPWYTPEHQDRFRSAVAVAELSSGEYGSMTAYNKKQCDVSVAMHSSEHFEEVPGWHFVSSSVISNQTIELMLAVVGDADYGNIKIVEIHWNYIVLYAVDSDLKSFLGLANELERLHHFV